MRAARRLRLAIAAVRLKSEIDSTFKVNQVSGRDKDGLHIRLRPQSSADDFAFINHLRPTAALLIGLPVLSDQYGLSAAQCRAVYQKTDVRGYADAARVRYALPVEHDSIRLSL